MLFQNRRILSLSFAVIMTVILASFLPHAVLPVLTLVLFLLSLPLFVLTRWHHTALTIALALLLAALALLSSAIVSGKREALIAYEGKPLSSSVTLTEVSPPRGGEIKAEGRTRFETEDGTVTGRVKVKAPIFAEAGDVLSGRATLYLTEEDSSAASQGFLGTLVFDRSARVTGESHSLTVAVGKLRAGLCERIESALPDESGAFLAAMLLGEREGLSASFERDMSRIGTIHILSLSGLHLAVLTAGLAFLLRHLRIGYRLRFMLLSLFALFFILLTGFSASVMRAGFMFAIAALPLLFREERDSLSALFVAVALILLITPYAVTDLGLWLSALSTLGILLLFDRFRGGRRKSSGVLRALLTSLAVTLTATVATLPLTLVTFGTLPLLSPLANLLLGPLSQLALYLAVLVALLGACPPFTLAAQAICEAIFTISRFLSDLPRTVLGVKGGAYLALPLLFALLILLYFCFCSRRRFRFFVPVALLFATLFSITLPLLAESHGRAKEAAVTRYTDGVNDCLHIETGGEHVLISLSRSGSISGADRAALRAVTGEVDLLMLPAYSEGALGGITAFLTEYKVRELLLPLPDTPESGACLSAILALAEEEGVRVSLFKETPISLRGATVSELILMKNDEETRALLTLTLNGRRVVYYAAREGEGLPHGYTLPEGAAFLGEGRVSFGKLR